MLTFES
jgi:serine/threonine-protein kinase mTOR